MTNYPIDNALMEKENIIEINLLNKTTGTTYSKAPVQGDNTLGQLVEEYAEDLGINRSGSKIHFENKRTGEVTSDPDVTVEELGLLESDVLAISDDAIVAGEEDFAIILLNKITGTTLPQVAVFGTNTLGQLVEEYGGDIGLTFKGKLLFENKRTGDTTSDSEETVDGLGLREGDVLAISDDGGVAAVKE